jgi:phenylacetic acid degradation operon negative regulatory protein
MLAPLGLNEAAVRTALSRIASRGWIGSQRVGRRSYYSLTSKGRTLLEEGEARIYHPDWDQPWSGEWLLLTYTIPEEDRHLRDQLRDRLTWLGFGSLGNGLWISPHDVEDEIREVSRSLGITDRVECFRGEAVGSTDPERLVARCWDLPAVNARYEEFIQSYSPQFRACRAAQQEGSLDPERAYVLRFELIHEYREFPSLDPFLPRALLPENWAGECAAHLFKTFHELLAGPADQYVDRLLSEAPAHKGGHEQSDVVAVGPGAEGGITV